MGEEGWLGKPGVWGRLLPPVRLEVLTHRHALQPTVLTLPPQACAHANLKSELQVGSRHCVDAFAFLSSPHMLPRSTSGRNFGLLRSEPCDACSANRQTAHCTGCEAYSTELQNMTGAVWRRKGLGQGAGSRCNTELQRVESL